jgi:hypothetical protein
MIKASAATVDARVWDRRQLLEGALTGLLLVAILLLGITRIVEHDVPWLLRAGDTLLARRSLPRVDPFSYTSDIPWLNHEWLSEIVLALSYRAAGFVGVGLVQGMAAAACAGILLWILPRRGLAWVALALWMLGTRDLLAPRAEIVSLPLAAAVYFLALRDLEQPSRMLFLAWPLQLVWTQLHGGNPVGVGILALAAVMGGREGLARRALVAAGAAALTCAGPYGWHVHEHLLNAGSSMGLVREWQPLWTLPFGDAPTVVALVLVVLGIFGLLVERFAPEPRTAQPSPATRRVLRMQAAAMVLFVVLALLYARFLREALLFAVPPAGLLLARIPLARSLRLALPFVILAAIPLATNARAGTGLEPNRFPEQAVAFLQRTQPPGPMFNSYNFGGYLIFAYPEQKVFIDGRAFTVYSRGFIDDLVRLYQQPERFDALEDKWGFRLAVLANTDVTRDLITHLVTSGHWKLAYRDDQAYIFTR